MSKIYEALRQAELDRAKTGATRSDSSAGESTAGQALLDSESLPAPVDSAAAFPTFAPITTPARERGACYSTG